MNKKKILKGKMQAVSGFRKQKSFQITILLRLTLGINVRIDL